MLSNAMGELKDRYGVVIIGSGYGGSISAARLAAAGYEVCVLERGKGWLPGEFPDELHEVIQQIRTARRPLGLYDYHVTRDIDVFVGCGLGGTSLINANVLIRPDSDIFDHPRWPPEIRRDRDTGRLDACYEQAASMLQASSLPESESPIRKAELHRKSGRGRPGRYDTLRVAVNFDRYEDEPNHVGTVQRRCIQCGDCVTGCNVSAKNTLAMNYLPFAKDAGASFFTGIEVDYITRASGGGYFVRYVHHGEDGTSPKSGLLHAQVAIVSGGTLGSTQILLKSRDRGLGVSERLGHYFSTNGDVLGMGFNNDARTDVLGFGTRKNERSQIRVGPTILSVIDYRNRKALEDRFIIEEGAIPSAFVDNLRYALPKIGVLAGDDTDLGVIDELSEASRIVRDLARYDVEGALNHSMIYLGMAHDGAEGVIALDAQGNIRIHWEPAPSRPIFEKIDEEMRNLTAALGGTYIRNPRWSSFFGRNLITVHPLGGCGMGRNVDEGVVDHRGRVFDPSSGSPEEVHRGLFVIDGSMIPTSLGVNPLWTISALSERITDLLIRDGSINREPKKGRLPVFAKISPPVGMEFTEEMRGYFTETVKNAAIPEQYREAEAIGRREEKKLCFKLTIYIDDVDRFVGDVEHKASATGYVTMGSQKYPVDRGQFQLFVKDPKRHVRRMTYSLRFRRDQDRWHLVDGYKEVKDDSQSDIWEIWRDTTTLHTTVYDGKTREAPILGQGLLHVNLHDLLEQVATFRVRNAPNARAEREAMVKFLSFFFGELWETYVRHLLEGQ